MFPASATRVTPIIRMAHSSSAAEARPSNWLKNAGNPMRIRALSPKTTDPARKTLRMLASCLEPCICVIFRPFSPLNNATGLLLAVIPIIFFYPFLQKKFTSGISSGAVK
jgi:hypothetical protein